jgi:cell division protein ZapA (FtsZ GTPase activity inhibitor)
MNEKVDVEVFKRRLTLEMDGHTPLEIAQFASQVSEKMQEISSRHKTIVDSSKLAILTAIEFAAELSKVQAQQDTGRRVIEHKVEQLTEALKAALSAAGRG